MGCGGSKEEEPVKKQVSTPTPTPSAPIKKAPLRPIPQPLDKPCPEKPSFAPGGSEEAYKTYMRLKLEWERYENRFILIDMIKKEHKERGCACNGGQGPCSDPLPS